MDGVNLGDPLVFSPATSFPTFGDFVGIVIKNAFVVAGLLSFIILILGGFRLIVAGGDTKKLDQARGAVSGAVTGLILVVSSYWIVQIVEAITGLPLLSPK